MKFRQWLEYLTIRRSGFFDAEYYLLRYPDVRKADIDPLWHFIEHGWREGRNPSPFFDTTYYLESNPDVRESGINPFAHYLKYGYLEGRRPHPYSGDLIRRVGKTKRASRSQDLLYNIGRRVFHILPERNRWRWIYWLYQHFGFLFRGVPHYENWRKTRQYSQFSIVRSSFLVNLDDVQPAEEAKGSIAIHFHIFYLDVIREFAALLKNMPFPYDLYISTPSKEIADLCERLYHNLPNVGRLRIELVENRGRNFAPLFCTFGEELSRYDFIAHLHSKKSLYNQGATQGWRGYLGDALLGSEQQIRKIITLLQKDEPYGMVYPQNYHLLPYWANTWLANESLAKEWSNRIGLTSIPRGYFDYPAGSMFWARVEAIIPLFKAGITLNDFPEETGQTDGTLAHVLERFLVLCSLEQGFQPAIIKDKTTPSWSSWRLEQYIARSYESLVELLNKPTIKLIAFDIFDTLILRPLLNPETIKEIVARKAGNGIRDLYQRFRVVAENQARKIKGKDVNLDEIYSQLGEITNFSSEVLSLLKQLEEDIELALAQPRLDGLELYRRALKTGKPVVLISDMFLPKTIIETCLKNSGIQDWHAIFLSGEIGVRKDSGELYKYVLDQFKISPDEMLMIGDNERSDVQVPCDMGSNYIHVMRPVELARGLPRWSHIINSIEKIEGEEKINAELPLALVLNKNYSTLSFHNFDFESIVNPDPYYLGFSLVGPLILSFVDWLLEQAKEDHIDHLYFLAREGRLIKTVYDEWCKEREDAPKSDYLVISRRAASVPAITSMEDILNIAKVEFYLDTIEKFLSIRYGLRLPDEKWKKLSDKFGWKPDRIVTIRDENIEQLLPLLEELKEDIFLRSMQERQGLLHYLAGLGIPQSLNPAVVDVGYSGSVQKYLNKLLRKKVHGYYLMTSERSRFVAQLYDVIVKGCFYQDLRKSSNMPVLYRYSFELEKLLSYNEPQIQFYEIIQDGLLKKHYRELTEAETESIKIHQGIHKGVLDFVNDAHSMWNSMRNFFRPSKRLACLIMEEFLANSSLREKQMLSNIVIDDYYCGRKLVH